MTANRIDTILRAFPTISLEGMGKVRLMNRIDTKYVTTTAQFERLLEMAADEYQVTLFGRYTDKADGAGSEGFAIGVGYKYSL